MSGQEKAGLAAGAVGAAGLLVFLAIGRPAGAALPARPEPSVVGASIADLQRAMAEKRVTSRQVTQQYLDRIRQYDPVLRAVMTLNPVALDEADLRDRERARGRVRGRLHGIPVALKDNIQVAGLRTTGGALAFATLVPPSDATVVTHLREAGAVILAKTSLTELANWVAERMANHANPVAGRGRNPYGALLDPGGSSSGVGTAVSFWAASVGTETSGSILTPSDRTMLVGVKPTVGRLSRQGVIPITADQDTPGPMARTVADAAAMLGAMEGVAPDPADPDTGRCAPPPRRDYVRGLGAARLRGARIGVPRRGFADRLDPARAAAFEEAIALLRREGATVVDPADLPSAVAASPEDNLFAWPICAGASDRKGRDADCSVVLKYGMKRDFNRWLTSLGDAAPVPSLSALRAWNLAHREQGALASGQARLDISDEMDLEADRARYEADRRRDLRLSRVAGIDGALLADRLDALLFAGPAGADVAARAGYPSVTVPFRLVEVGTPFGVAFTGTACREPALLTLAAAFERASRGRVAPPGFP